jgi:hypothetical protein
MALRSGCQVRSMLRVGSIDQAFCKKRAAPELLIFLGSFDLSWS